MSFRAVRCVASAILVLASASWFASPASALTKQSIAFKPPASLTLLQTPYKLAATASSGLAVALASSTPSVCTVSGKSLTLLTVGTCTVTASQAGSAVYAAATSVTKSITVTKVRQTFAFKPPPSLTLVQTPYTLSPTTSSGLPVSFATSTSSVCTVSGTSLTLVAVGTCSVTASQSGNAFYAAAPSVTKTITVTKARPVLTFRPRASLTLLQTPYTLSATTSSGLPITFAESTPLVCTASGNSLALLSVGTCTVTASQTGNAIYSDASVTKSITVTKAPQTISFSPPVSLTLAQTGYALSPTATSGLAVTIVASSGSGCSVAGGNTLTISAVGKCTLTASQSGNANYAAASTVTKVITITG